MANREDVFIRTLAQKTHAANRQDAHLRTGAQKVASGAIRTVWGRMIPQSII